MKVNKFTAKTYLKAKSEKEFYKYVAIFEKSEHFRKVAQSLWIRIYESESLNEQVIIEFDY